MAMVSFGHPVHHQDAKEKPLQTQKKTNHRGIMSRPDLQWEHCKAPQANCMSMVSL